MSTRSLNKVMLIGNLTRDPELRYTPQGSAVCSFGLATNRSWLPSDSTERKEEAEFHRIVAWNKLAEICSQLLTKGRKIYIEGRLQTRSWETPEGDKRQATEIVAEDMMILDPRRTEGASESAPVAPAAVSPTTTEAVGNKEPAAAEVTGAASAVSEASPAETPKEPKKDEPEDKIDIDDIPF